MVWPLKIEVQQLGLKFKQWMCGFCDYVTLCHHSIALIAETKSPRFHQYAPKLTQQTYCGQNILPKWSLNSDAVAENQLNNTKNTCKSLCLLVLPAFFNCSNHLPTYKSPPNRGPCRPGCIENSKQAVLCTEGADAAFAGHALDGTFDVAICSVPRYKKALIIAWVFPYNDLRPNPGMMVRGKYPKKVLFQVSETLRCT